MDRTSGHGGRVRPMGIAAAACLALLVVGASSPARAQSPEWTANLVVQPYPSPFLADWERNPQTVILTLLYTGSQPQDFRVEGYVVSPTRGELARVESPPVSIAFGPVTQVFSGADVLQWSTVSRDQQYTDQVLRTGTIPEGPLRLCARVVGQGEQQLVEACSDFTVVLPEPPQLVFPSNGDQVPGLLPVFQWTPVFLPPELGVAYRLKVVEVVPGQTPEVATEANPPWFEAETQGIPMASYPLDALPLDPARAYAWSVEALDGDGRPVTRGGRSSEIWTFSVGAPGKEVGLTAELPDTLVLIPGVARIVGLKSTQITGDDFSYVLNGWLNLEIQAPFPAVIDVQARDLEIDKASLATQPLIRGGQLTASLSPGDVPEDVSGPLVRFDRIDYDPASGLRMSASLQLPGLSSVTLEGQAMVTGAGVYGSLIAQGDGDAPLLALGEDPVRLLVRRAGVTFPGGQVTLDGGLEVFATDLGCAGVRGTVDENGVLTASAACNPSSPLSLGGGDTDRARISLRGVGGSLSVGLADGGFSYALRASGDLRLDMGLAGGPTANCGASMTLDIADGDVTVPEFSPRCDAGEGDADLGWLHTRLSSLSLDRFAYVPGRGFDFALSVNLAPWIPAVPGIALPELVRAQLTQDGFAIPATDVTVSRPPVSLLGFAVAVKRVSLPGFTLSWSDWQLGSADGFRFAVDADISMPELPGTTPSCMAGKTLRVTGAEIADGRFRAQLQELSFDPACALTLRSPDLSLPGGSSTSGGSTQGADSTGAAASGAQADSAGAPGQASQPEDWEDPYAGMVESGSQWSAPPLLAAVAADSVWPTDPARKEALFRRELDTLQSLTRAVDDALNAIPYPCDTPVCKRMLAAADSASDRAERARDSIQSLWFERDFGAKRRATAECLAQARQQQLLGVTEDPESTALNCTSAALNDTTIAQIIKPYVTWKGQDGKPLNPPADCENVLSYGAQTVLGMERQRQLLGVSQGEGISADMASVIGIGGYCAQRKLDQLQEACSNPNAGYYLLQSRMTSVIGSERQAALLGYADSSSTSNVFGIMESCASAQRFRTGSSGGGGSGGDGAWGAAGSGDGGGWGPWVPDGGPVADLWSGLDRRSPEDPVHAWLEEPLRRAVRRKAPEALPPPPADSGGIRLELTRIGGELSVRFAPFLSVERVPEIEGAIVLPSLFQCPDSASLREPLVTKLRLGPHGELNGTVYGFIPKCPMDVAAAKLTVTDASLRFSTASGNQEVVLTAAAEASFTLASTPVQGEGAVSVDLIHGRLLDGSLRFTGPLQVDLPQEQRVMSFTLQSVSLDRAGVHVDGRAQLLVGDGQTIGATFDQVVIDPRTVALTSGQVAFDLPFGFQVGLDGGGLSWKAVPREAPLGISVGARLDLPSRIALGVDGFTASGDGGARLVYEGRDVDSLSARFSPDFALGLNPAGVTAGQVEFLRGGVSLATIDAAGFHPNLAYFAAALIPDRLPLPTESVAYLELRDAQGNLRVQTENTGSGVRLFTTAAQAVPLVVPALQLDRPTAPRVNVGFDVTIDPLGAGLKAGSISVTLPPADRAGFDLAALGLPLAIDSLSYDRDPQGAYRFAVGASLVLFGQADETPASRVLLTLDGAGRLAGSVDVTLNRTIPLVPGSDKLSLDVGTVQGSFDAALATGQIRYSLNLDGGLELRTSSTERYRADATFQLTETGLETGAVRIQAPDSLRFIDLPGFRMGLGNLRVPELGWDPESGFSFEVLFDVALAFPTLGDLTLPPITDVSLRNDGFTIPAYEVPDLRLGTTSSMSAPLTIGGFTVEPLAFRMAEVRYNWFTGQGPSDWGFGFDVELGFPELPAEAPQALQNVRLRLLDAGLRNGQLHGSLEPVTFVQPIDLGIGSLRALWGEIPEVAQGSEVPDTAAILHAVVDLDLDTRLGLCDGHIGTTGDTLAVYSDGWVSGRIRGIVPQCPVEAGPFRLSFGGSELLLDAQPGPAGSRTRRAELDVSARLDLPGQSGDTVSAQGNLRFDILNGRMVDGFINVDRPFRWQPPGDNPYLRFDVDQGRLDAVGFHFTGGGQLRLADGATVGVSFNDLTLGLPDLELKDGSVTFTSAFALGVGLDEGGAMTWGAYSLSAPPPSGSSFRVALPEAMTLDAQGLSLTGTASASLRFADQDFATLNVSFVDGFRVGLSPVGVASGRANFLLNADTVAYATPQGFFPGNVFAAVPVPARLGLPNEQTAYLELRDGQGALQVATSSGQNGLRLQTRGQGVRLVVPALAGEGGEAPSVQVSFDVVVNPVTFALVSGSVEATAPSSGASLLSLAQLGLPLDVTRLAYGPVGGNGAYGLSLDARVDLPASLSAADLVLQDVTVTEQGLSGTAELGTYSDTYNPSDAPFKTIDIDPTTRLGFTGVQVTFGQAPDVRLAGTVTSKLFAGEDTLPVPLFFTAQASATGFAMSVDPGKQSRAVLPILVATFEPQSLAGRPAIEVRATNQEFAVRMSGVLRLPTLAPNLAVTLDGLEVGSAGVKVPSVSLASGGNPQALQLFGATLTLQDSVDAGQVVYPAVAGGYADGMLSLTLSGTLDFLDNTARFAGLTVTSAGSLTLASANLLSSPVDIVSGVLALNELTVRDSRLRAGLAVTLPAPLDRNGPQSVFFEVAPNGELSGGGQVTLVQEAAGLNTSSPTTMALGVADIHLRYLGLNLDAGAIRNSSVEAVADVYLGGEEDNLIQVGDIVGSAVQPGLRVGFDGSVTWGSPTLAREFTFDLDAVRLTLTNVTFPAQRDGFAIGFGGDLALAMDQVSGSLAFQDFVLTSAGEVEFSPTGVQGGELSIVDVVTLSVEGFSYSASPTTIEVKAGSMPGGGQAASSGTETIPVRSYVRFGGSISVADVFSGGVDEFLAYVASDGATHLVVHDASLSIQDVVSMSADFKYDQKATGFEMVMGANGQLFDTYAVSLVGAIAQEQAVVRVGVFLAAEGLSIPVPGVPVLTISGLGGGFFLNPKAEYLDMVRSAANVSQTAGKKIAAPPGNFAVMLYGAVSIVTQSVAQGRVLLTVMNTAIQIDGALEMLGQGDSFSGDAHLVIGLQKAYAEGNVGLNVDVAGVITGTGSLDFYVYSADNWGILGQTDVTIVSFLKGGSRLAVLPAGFVVSANISGGYDIWVVHVENSFLANVWYKTSVGEFGAYLEISVEASVLGGVASAKGTLLGALIMRPSPLVFAAALLRLNVVGLSWEGMVWAKFDNGQASAGFGSDPTMDAAIAAAHDVADEMTGAADAAQSAVDQSRNTAPSAVALTDQELAQAYNNIQGWSPSGWNFAWFIIAGSEYTAAYQGDNTEGSYESWYNNTLRRVGQPGDSASVAQLTATVGTQFSAAESERSAVEARLSALQMGLQPMVPRAPVTLSGNPLTVSLDPPVTSESTDADGRTTKVVTSGPSFDVDVGAAQAAVSALTQARSDAEALDLEVRQRIVAMESGLAASRAAVTGTGPGAFLSFANHYAAITSAAEEQFAAQADLLLQRQDWTRSKLTELSGKQSTAFGWVAAKTQALRSQGTSQAFNTLRTLTSQRVKALVAFSGSSQLASDFARDSADAMTRTQDARWTYFAQEADSVGRQLWYHLARVGMSAADAGADTEFGKLRTAAESRLATIRDAHGALSTSLASLYESQAAAAGALYDLYDRYLFWKTGETSASSTTGTGLTLVRSPRLTSSSGLTSTPVTDAASLADPAVLRRRKAELAQELTVPTVNSVQVTPSSPGRYRARLDFTWSGWHPNGTTEFVYRDAAGADQPLGGQFYSDGSSSTFTSALFTPDRTAGGTVSGTFQVGVRGGAGFTGFGRTNYSVTFPAGTAPATGTGSTASVTGTGLLADATPPSAPVVRFPGRTIQLDPTGGSVWTADSQELDVAWEASDPESGISQYEYALWSTPTGQAPASATGAAPLPGELRPFTAVGGRNTLTLSRLGLVAGQPVYVAVRARNGQGLTGAVGVSAAIRLDTTGPAFAGGAAISLGGLRVGRSIQGLTTAIPVLPPCPVPAPTPVKSRTLGLPPTPATPAVTFSHPLAADAESGVAEYWWRVGSAPDTAFGPGGWTREDAPPAFTASGAPLDYAGSFYVSVAPVNGAGVAGAPISYGPFSVSDPTDPTAAGFCAGLGGTNDRLTATVTTASSDPETGLAGYQYRVRTASGAVVRSWPASGVDWAGAGTTLTTGPIAFVGGQSYLLDLRPVNGQGMVGPPVASGPVLVDLTPPPLPGGAVTYPLARGRLTSAPALQLDIPDDPETGITRVEIAVGTGAGKVDVLGWTALSGVGAGTSQVGVPVMPLQMGGTYWLRIRSVNGAGMASRVFETTWVAP